jgi:hypothetical protein
MAAWDVHQGTPKCVAGIETVGNVASICLVVAEKCQEISSSLGTVAILALICRIYLGVQGSAVVLYFDTVRFLSDSRSSTAAKGVIYQKDSRASTKDADIMLCG